MTWKWYFSRTVRQAHHAARHVRKLVDHQRDILSPQAIDAVEVEIAAVDAMCATGSKPQIVESVGRLEKAANKWLKPYPHPAWRENVEVMLVAIAVAMGIRTFFLQPFKIPTGSMQPTLYGVTDENLLGRETKIPNAAQAFLDYWFRGVSYFRLVAKGSGAITFDPPVRFILFNLKQTYYINGAPQSPVWFPPDNLFERGRVFPGTVVRAGDEFLKLRVISGDHLFVDRVTYNFRRPSRGDVVVFETHGITRLRQDQQDTYYIKRLVGLGGETISLKPDYTLAIPQAGGAQYQVGHLVVDGHEITASTPHFENLYAFADAPHNAAPSTNVMLQFHENHYYGHSLIEELGPGMSVHVPPDHYFVMGDNTMNSSDSRFWGDFPQERVIGKSFFVYWPIGGTTFKGEERASRFGWAHR